MRTRAKRSLRAGALALAVLLLLQGNAWAAEPPKARFDYAKAGAVTFDVIVLRPLGFAAFVVGAAFLVPVTLFTVANGKDSLDQGMETFVGTPARDVFQRELGDF